jgi:hypothetical protein
MNFDDTVEPKILKLLLQEQLPSFFQIRHEKFFPQDSSG